MLDPLVYTSTTFAWLHGSILVEEVCYFSFELNVESAKVCTSQLVLRQHVNGKDASKQGII